MNHTECPWMPWRWQFAPFEDVSPVFKWSLLTKQTLEGKALLYKLCVNVFRRLKVQRQWFTISRRLRFPSITRRWQQWADTYCFGQWSVRGTDLCPSSASRPAGPACWAPESKDGDPWPALTNHPDRHCPRGQTPHNLWAKQQGAYISPPLWK